MNRQMLVIAYEFPPCGGSGVQRTAKFVKYLDRVGTHSIVVTPNRKSTNGDSHDDDLCLDIPDSMSRSFAGQFRNGRSGFWHLASKTPILWRWISVLEKNFGRNPDTARYWQSKAINKGCQILKAGNVDVLYSTSPPVSSHCVALKLKKKFGIPWVADFRDPWTSNKLGYPKKNLWKWRLASDRRLEGTILHTADMVIANTQENRNRLIIDYQVAAKKIIAIPNGYDEDDFILTKRRPPKDVYRVSYTGSAYGKYNPAAFIEILKGFLKVEPNAKIEWVVAGTACKWIDQNVKEKEILERYHPMGYISHSKIPDLLASSHLLLHHLPADSSYWVPGKLYEYLRSGTLILAISDRPSEVERILHETGRGKVFTHGDIKGAVHFLLQQYREWKETGAARFLEKDDRIVCYSREYQANQLNQVLESVCSAN